MAVNGAPATEDEFWLFGYGQVLSWDGVFLNLETPNGNPRRSRINAAQELDMEAPAAFWRIPGWVTGYVRRFWQASEDHRGTPEAPGRVVTLIERSFWEQLTDHHGTAPDKVWGVAYRIQADKVTEVKEYLDIREINGYTIHYTPFHPAPGVDPALVRPVSGSAASSAQQTGGSIRTLVYIGTPDNAQFVGPQDPQALAEHIYRSVGPSGLNRDYLWGLEKALNDLSPESGDAHITDLSDRVRAVAAREEGALGAQISTDKVLCSLPPVHVSPGAHPQHEFKRAGSVDEQEETEKTS